MNKSKSELEAGSTFNEMMENSKKIKQFIDKGIYPEGTSKSDWMIVGDYAVYTPYIPLMMTPPPAQEFKKDVDAYMKERDGY